MSAANPTDSRSLWLNSPDCLLQVLCLVAQNGHDARNFSSLCMAFREDTVLWDCIKDRRGRKGMTVLMACSKTGDLARVRWLLDRGASVNAVRGGVRSDLNLNSLMAACQHGHLEVVRELLGRGANVNGTSEWAYGDKTSLMRA
jgi:hypothetical protein